MFRQLLGVQRHWSEGGTWHLVGAASGGSASCGYDWGCEGDLRAPGVGAKTAQRIILDLKDKVQAEDLLTPLLDGSAAVSPAEGNGLSGNAVKEAVEALVALGYTNAEAVKAVKSANVTEEMDSEAVLKASLKYLAFL